MLLGNKVDHEGGRTRVVSGISYASLCTVLLVLVWLVYHLHRVQVFDGTASRSFALVMLGTSVREEL